MEYLDKDYGINNRKKTAERALLECVVSSDKYIFARALDFLAMFIVPIIVVIFLFKYVEPNEIIAYLSMFSVFTVEIIRIFTKGTGIGFLLFNIRFVDEMTCKRITFRDYWEYWGSKIAMRFYHTSLFTSWSITSSPKTQTKAMEENCILAVDLRLYNKFLEKYMDGEGNIINRKHKDYNQTPSEILTASTTRIFRDED